MSLHYHKIVQNEWFGYPQEWFPSVSATIGDRYPERSFFQLFIAITSGPRFALVGFWYLLSRRPGTKLPGFVAFWGVFRTLTCGGWTYITSTDDHDWHDIFMISYLLATIPWTFGCLALSPPNPTAIKYRKYVSGAFYGSILPLIYFFIQHKVHRVPGGKSARCHARTMGRRSFCRRQSSSADTCSIHIQPTPPTRFSSGRSSSSMSHSTP